VPKIDLTIHIDASNKGWGITDGISPSGGLWNSEEKLNHINWLELKAIDIGLQSYTRESNFQHVRIMCDNTTAMSYINNMGGMQSVSCDSLAGRIWAYAISKKFWISAAFIPGKQNTTADKFSRVFHDNTEWMLNPLLFKKICDIAYTPEIDLFASRINKQIDKYVSWHPDPEATAIDAFSLTWDCSTLYMFPPFSIITRVTKKIREDQATGILVVPD